MSEIIGYLFFPVWLISLSMIPSRSIHIVAKGKILFFTVAEAYSIVYIHTTSFLSIYLLMDSGFHILAIINKATINIVVHIRLQITVFIFFPEKYS